MTTEEQTLTDCYGISDPLRFIARHGGVIGARLQVARAMDQKLPGIFGKASDASRGTARIRAWGFNPISGKLETASFNPSRPRPTMARVNRFAFFYPAKSGTTGSRSVEIVVSDYQI